MDDDAARLLQEAYDNLARDVRELLASIEADIAQMKITRGEAGGIGPYGCLEGITSRINDFKNEDRPDLF